MNYRMNRGGSVIRMVLICLVISLSTGVGLAQGSDSTLFDFWLGRWSLTWTDTNGAVAHGENTITRILDGKVIQEHFRALDGSQAGFEGTSVSVLSAREGRWKQTWVDNQGGYLDFSGGSRGNDRYFTREFTNPQGKTVRQQMVFYNIQPNSFDWIWERSLDNANTWEKRWEIHYTRGEEK